MANPLMRRDPLFECQECGKKFFSVAAAERATFRDGCPQCGGSDIDTYVIPASIVNDGTSGHVTAEGMIRQVCSNTVVNPFGDFTACYSPIWQTGGWAHAWVGRSYPRSGDHCQETKKHFFVKAECEAQCIALNSGLAQDVEIITVSF